MEYSGMRKTLSEDEFAEFLFLAGTDEEKFDEYSGKFCTGDPAAKYCGR
jgi:hypothetical protein